MLFFATISIICLFLVVIPCMFAVMQYARYKANGGKRNDFISFCLDYLKEIC